MVTSLVLLRRWVMNSRYPTMLSWLTGIITMVQKQVSQRGKGVKPRAGSAPIDAVHPHPISRDRLRFVIARIAILTDMIVELSTRGARYQQNAGMSSLHSTVVTSMRAEHLELLVEKSVLEEVIKNIEQKVGE